MLRPHTRVIWLGLFALACSDEPAEGTIPDMEIQLRPDVAPIRLDSGVARLDRGVAPDGTADMGGEADEGTPGECEDGDRRACPEPECAHGEQICAGGAWGACEGPAELCDGEDNDCDGEIDEDFPDVGDGCVIGEGLCRAEGTIVCAEDGSEALCDAEEIAPADEICDGEDNDCDGVVDNACLCSDENPCPDGLTCEEGRCMGDECRVSADCSGGELCEDGLCVPPEPECAVDGDCEADESCVDGRCVPPEPECVEDFDCPGAEVCVDGACAPASECAVDGDCPEGQGCQAGHCAALGCDEDPVEPNDEQAEAFPLTPGTLSLGLCDEDWFEIQVCAGGRVDIELTFIHADGDLDARLVDADGAELSEGASSNDNEQLFINGGEQDSVAWLQVYGYQGAQNSYQITLTETCPDECAVDGDCPAGQRCVNGDCVAAPACAVDGDCPAGQICEGGACVPEGACRDDAFEPNDEAGEAAVLTPGHYEGLRACPEDADVYAFEACRGAAIAAHVRFTHADGDLDALLLDAHGQVLAEGGSSDDDEYLAADSPASGRIYLVVLGYEGAENDYVLDLDVGECGACADDIDEPNNTVAEATGVIPPINLIGRQLCDVDHYAVEICEGGTLNAQATFRGGEAALQQLALVDEAGATLIDSQPTEAEENSRVLAAQAQNDGVFTVRVSGDADEYDLSLIVEGCGCYNNGECEAGQICEDHACVPAPECPDDALEDNDAPEAARPLLPGAHPNLFLCGADEDWYLVELCAGGTLNVDVRFTHANGDLDARLYAPDGTNVAAGTSVNDDETLSFTTIQDTALLLHVYGFQGAWNDYALEIEAAGCAGPVCVDDASEQNDNPAQSAALPGAAIPLRICADDVDFFTVERCAGGALTATLQSAEAAGLEMSLVDAAGQPLAAAAPVDGGLLIQRDLAVDGPAHLRIAGVGGAEPRYTLDAEVTGCGCVADRDCEGGMICEGGECVAPPACEDDRMEDNDTAEAARPIVPGALSAVICAGDEDWYELEVCAGGFVAFDVGFVHAQGDLDIALYDDNNQRISASATNHDGEHIEHTAPQDQRLRLRVSGLGDAANAYQLNVQLFGCEAPTCPDDGYEDNDEAADAAPLPAGEHPSLALCPNDFDWYLLDVCAGGTLTATALFNHADGDVDLRLEALDGALLDSALGATGREEVRWQSAEAARARLLVYGANVENFYDLEIRVEGCGCATDRDCPAGFLCEEGACVEPPACVDDAAEENDVAADAAPLEAGAYQICAGDEDWFELDLCADGALVVDARFTHADGDLDVRLYDAEGRYLRGSSSASDDEHLEYTASADARLYLKVSGFSGAENGYTLEPVITGCDAPVCVDDAGEEDDDQATARAISVGAPEAARVCSGDEDWFTLEGCPSGVLTAQLRFSHADGDLDLEIRDADRRLALSQTVTDNEEIRQAVEAGPLYLRVYSPSAGSADYQLTVDLAECGCVDDRDCEGGQRCEAGECVDPPACVEDGYEDNDDQASARLLEEDIIMGMLCPADEDWFSLDVCAGGSARAVLTLDESGGDLDLALYGPEGLITRAATNELTEQILWASEADTRYALAVTGFDAEATGDYLLEVEVTGCDAPVCVDDGDEDNDDRASATSIDPDLYPDRVICSGDEDFYAIEVCEGGALTAEARFTHADGDLEMGLYRGETRVAYAVSSDDDEAIRFDATADETLHLRVYGFQGASNHYDLDVAVDGCVCDFDFECPDNQRCEGTCLPCAADPEEPNEDRDQAALIESGGVVNRTLCKDDEDWFVIPVCAGGTLIVDAEFIDDDGDIDLTLRDANDSYLTSETSVDDNEHMEWTADEDTWASLRVYGFGHPNDYRLSVNVTGCDDACVDDASEENDAQEAAASIATGSFAPWQAICDDGDWYSVPVCGGAPFAAHIRFSDDVGDLDMELRDAEGVFIARSSSTTDDESIRHTPAEDGALLLKVYPYLSAEAPYQLEIEPQVCP